MKNKTDSLFISKWGEKENVYLSSKDKADILFLGSCDSRNLQNLFDIINHKEKTNCWDLFYNPFSILFELERVFLGKKEWKKSVYYYTKNGIKYFKDPWRTWISGKSMDELTNINKEIDKKAKKILSKKKTIVFFLGLAEIWTDLNTNKILNRIPIELSTKKIRNNYKPEIASINQITKTLKKIDSICKKKINCKTVFAVSPIPLKYSSVYNDIKQANSLSKFNLHYSCLKLAKRNINYFPSIDIINENDFQIDKRHLLPEAVIRLFERLVNQKICKYKKNKDILNQYFVPKVNKQGTITGNLYLKKNDQQIQPG